MRDETNGWATTTRGGAQRASRCPSRLAACFGRVALLAALVCAAGPVLAQSSIRISHVEAAPGDQSIFVLVTARNDEHLHGYSLAITFPPDVFFARALNVDGTHVAAADPEFVAPRINNELGIATLGVILNYSDSSEARALEPTTGDGERIIARLILDVFHTAPGGVYPIRLEDGIGTPSAYNRFTNAGRSIVPTLHHGSISITGPNVIAIEKKLAFAGATPNLPMFVYARHPDPLAGYSVAASFDCRPGYMSLLEASLAQTDVQFILGSANKIEFFETGVEEPVPGLCRSYTGVLFDYVAPFDGQTLPPSTRSIEDQSILRYRFSIGANARSEREYQDIILNNRSEPGSVNNIFVVDQESLSPVLDHGKIYFSTGSIRGRVVDRLSGEPVAGATVRLEPGGQETTTTANGTFRISGAIPGKYRARVGALGFYDGFFRDLEVTGASSEDDWGDLSVFSVPASSGMFRRGFVNPDLKADISDSVWLLNWLFKGGEEPECLLAADVNDDDRNDISDPIYLLGWLFGGGPRPPPPVDACGTDPTSPLSCHFSIGCP